MEKLPFYLCSGFHRSGTSLVSLSMINNGIDMGPDLMGANVSNALGHGEDIAFVNLHEQLLQSNGSDWRYYQQIPPRLMNDSIARMQMYIKKRYENLNPNTLAFGAKDPRALFFLDAWYTACQQNIKFILVFRDWKFAVSSLLKRHSRSLLQFNQPMSQRPVDLDFWRYPDLAATMWLASAEKMLDCVKLYPAKTLLFEHTSIIEKNELLCRAAAEKGILINALKCEVFQPELMQQNIPDSMLEMISPSLKQKCDAMLVSLREAAAVSSRDTAKCRSVPQLVNDVMNEGLFVTTSPKKEQEILQLPTVASSKIRFKNIAISDCIARLKTMPTDMLGEVDWDELLKYPDISANENVELFYLSVKAKAHFASEIFITRAIHKRELYWQWVHLGDYYFKLKHFDSASRCYIRADNIEPEHAGIIAKLADIATVEKRYDDSHALIERAQAINYEHGAIKDARIRLNRALSVNAESKIAGEQIPKLTHHDRVEQNDGNIAKVITDYSLVTGAASENPELGKRLEHYMVETSLWARNNNHWLKSGMAQLTEASQRCLLDYLFVHLQKYWSTESLYAEFIQSEDTIWKRFTSGIYSDSVFGEYELTDVNIGVHIHVSHLCLLPEIIAAMHSMPNNTRLLISCPLRLVSKINEIKALSNNCKVVPFDEAGGDVAPWLLGAVREFKHCNLVLKLHTKATLEHEPQGWRSQLLWSLLGNQDNVVSIIERFTRNDKLGVLLPEYHPNIVSSKHWGDGEKITSEVAANLGLPDLPEYIGKFPAGRMFWYRPSAISSLTENEWCLSQISLDNQSVDGALIQALERLICISASHAGYAAEFINRFPQK